MQDCACHICNYSARQKEGFLLVADDNRNILTIVQGIRREYALKLASLAGEITCKTGQKIY